jgi:histidinol-phosphate aminotransferase
MSDSVDKWVRSEIRKLSAYHVPNASGFIKLDAMENPYHWPDSMVKEWLAMLRKIELNRYPDPAASELNTQIRSSMHVPASRQVLLGNGSDELIQMILMAVSGADRIVLSPEPGFVMYRMIATFLNMPYVGVPLKKDFSLDRQAMLKAIEQHDPAVVFLAYPNNPTGNLFAEDVVEEILQTSNGLVVLDEAYHAFAGKTWMDKLEQYENLLVMRTVSKMGLAGLRLGLLAGSSEWLGEFDKVRLPYNINVLTQASARFALQNQGILDEQTAHIRADRDAMYDELCAIDAIEVFPSQANFILFRTRETDATSVFEVLKKEKILIKNLSAAGGLLSNCLRVTVGTPEENAAFLFALKDALS